MKAHSGAYQAAYRNGWLDEICSHMDQRKYWEMEEAKERALKYTYISDFMANDYPAYQYAFQRRIVRRILFSYETFIPYL